MRLGLKTVVWPIQMQDRSGGLLENNSVHRAERKECEQRLAMGRPVWLMEDSCRTAVGGKIREESILKGLPNQAKLIQLGSVLNGIKWVARTNPDICRVHKKATYRSPQSYI